MFKNYNLQISLFKTFQSGVVNNIAFVTLKRKISNFNIQNNKFLLHCLFQIQNIVILEIFLGKCETDQLCPNAKL